MWLQSHPKNVLAHGRSWLVAVFVLVLLVMIASNGHSTEQEPPVSSLASSLIVPLDHERIMVADRIIVHRTERTVTIPAVVNQRQGLIEYVLVHNSGKRHEALLVTDVRPQDIHLACLLAYPLSLGDKTAPGTLVTVHWQRHGPAACYGMEKLLVLATPEGEPLANGDEISARWLYHGSYFSGDGFAASQQGSCITLQPDPAALITGAGLPAGHFAPQEQLLPAIGTPVSVVLTLPPLTLKEMP
jgi:hypothetical protein